MLQKEVDLSVFVRIVSWFHCKLSSELLQDVVLRERPLELVISLQKNCAVVNARHVLEQAGIKQEELELIQLVKGGEDAPFWRRYRFGSRFPPKPATQSPFQNHELCRLAVQHRI